MSTILEILTSEYGDNWERSMSHVIGHYAGYHGDVITFNLACEYDPWGYEDAVSVSNYRTLFGSWGELECWHASPYPQRYVALDLGSEAPDDLTDVIDRLADYPILDESLWSEVEQEIIGEHYESYGRHDIIAEIGTRLGIDAAKLNLEAAVDTLVWSDCFGEYPNMIDATACDFNRDAVVDFIAEHAGTVATIEHYGDSVQVDLTALSVVA